MKVSEFKKACDSLSRFATTREKASGPESLIGVQKKDDTLKFISGHSKAGMAVTIKEHESKSGNYAFAVAARPLIQASKVLPARAEIAVMADKDGLHLKADGGGTIDLRAEMPLREAGFAKKPKTDRVQSGPISAVELKRIAKLFKAISAKVMVPTVQIIRDTGYATTVSPGEKSMYANFRFPAESINGEADEYSMAAYREFWEALTHFTEDGIMSWDKSGVMVTSGDMTCFSAPYLTSKWDEKTRTAGPPQEVEAWPILVATEASDVSFTLARRDLLSAVKGQAPFDELNRVTLEVTSGSLRVSPFGSADGMDLPCETQGKGIRSVNADYLTALLNAMDSKEVTLRWSGGVPAISITSKDYSSWTILLAPVTL